MGPLRIRVRARLFRIGAERRMKEVVMTVGTGATYPVIPRTIAEELRLEPAQTQTFRLADGRRVRRRLAWAGIAVDGQKSPTLVVLAGAKDPPLLGAFALEGLGLEVDPVARRLRPAERYLLCPRGRTRRERRVSEGGHASRLREVAEL